MFWWYYINILYWEEPASKLSWASQSILRREISSSNLGLKRVNKEGRTGGPKLPPPDCYTSGSRAFFLGFLLLALFLLQNITHRCLISPFSSRFPPFKSSQITALSSPAFRTPSALYSPGLQPHIFPYKEAEGRGKEESTISEFVNLLLLKRG